MSRQMHSWGRRIYVGGNEVHVSFRSNMSEQEGRRTLWFHLSIQLILPLSVRWGLGLSPYLDVGPCGFLSVGSLPLRGSARRFLVVAIATHRKWTK